MASVQAHPTPAVLVWARETAGLTHEAIAKKLKVGVERIRSWESGSDQPSLAQLRKLATATRRPLAVFYLPEAPRTFEAMHDFRAGTDSYFVTLRSPSLTTEIRKARDRREWALELLEQLEERPPLFGITASLDQAPESTAQRLRAALGVSTDTQGRWRADYEAFREWRKLLERAGVLTFQATDIDLAEARGFSISLKPLPVAVVNIKDAYRGRIFTLLHELAHIALNDGGICDLDDNERQNESARIEAYCNHVAGAVLYPKDELLAADVMRHHPKNQLAWSEDEIVALSRKFGGSREALLVRLLTLGLTNERFYRSKREDYRRQYAKWREERKGGFALPHVVALASAGLMFTGLVIEGFNRERITASDVSDYLDIRIKHLPEIERDLVAQTG